MEAGLLVAPASGLGEVPMTDWITGSAYVQSGEEMKAPRSNQGIR